MARVSRPAAAPRLEGSARGASPQPSSGGTALDPEHVANLHLPAYGAGRGPPSSSCTAALARPVRPDDADPARERPRGPRLRRPGTSSTGGSAGEGGGWPGTFEDVAAAADGLCDVSEAETARTIALGHSAGGQLALWLAAARSRTERGGYGRARRSRSQGWSTSSVRRGRGSDRAPSGIYSAAAPMDMPDRYAQASPAALAPLGVPQLIVHGGLDEAVPPALSRRYAAAARKAGDRVELLVFPAAGHFDVVDPGHASWAAVADRLTRLLDVDSTPRPAPRPSPSARRHRPRSARSACRPRRTRQRAARCGRPSSRASSPASPGLPAPGPSWPWSCLSSNAKPYAVPFCRCVLGRKALGRRPPPACRTAYGVGPGRRSTPAPRSASGPR